MPVELFPSLLAQAGPSSTTNLIDSLARTPLSQVLVFVAALTVVRVAVFPYLTKSRLRGPLYGVVRGANEILDAMIYAGVFVFMLIRPFGVQTFTIPTGSMWPSLFVNDFIIANKAIYRYSDPKPGDIVVFRPPAIAVNPGDPNPIEPVNIDYIKRCIGVPGDVVELREGVLYRNGQRVEEEYKNYSECTDTNRSNCVSFRALNKEEIEQLTPANFKLVKRDGEIIPLNWTEFDANAPMPRTRNWNESALPYVVASKFLIGDEAEAESLKNAPAEKIPAGYYLMLGDNRNGSFDSRGWGLVPRESVIGRSEFIWLPISRWSITR